MKPRPIESGWILRQTYFASCLASLFYWGGYALTLFARSSPANDEAKILFGQMGGYSFVFFIAAVAVSCVLFLPTALLSSCTWLLLFSSSKAVCLPVKFVQAGSGGLFAAFLTLMIVHLPFFSSPQLLMSVHYCVAFFIASGITVMKAQKQE